VRWIFVAMAQTPMVSSMSSVKASDKEQANKEVGALFMRVITEACAEKTRTAMKLKVAGCPHGLFQVTRQGRRARIVCGPERDCGDVRPREYFRRREAQGSGY
jgi:hypothetical protein